MEDNKAVVAGCCMFVFAIVNVAIGATFQNDCSFAVPTYLMAGGGITLALFGACMIAHLTPCECDNKIITFLSPFVALAQFCILMWGTILVFGWYSTWVYEPQYVGTPEYCGYTPYMYSFVMLIIGWCTLPFLIFCCCAYISDEL